MGSTSFLRFFLTLKSFFINHGRRPEKVLVDRYSSKRRPVSNMDVKGHFLHKKSYIDSLCNQGTFQSKKKHGPEGDKNN